MDHTGTSLLMLLAFTSVSGEKRCPCAQPRRQHVVGGGGIFANHVAGHLSPRLRGGHHDEQA
jgi:hypothetical protein